MRKRWDKGTLWKTGLISLQQTTQPFSLLSSHPSLLSILNSSSFSIFFTYYHFFFSFLFNILLYFFILFISLSLSLSLCISLPSHCLLTSALFPTVLTRKGSLLTSIGVLKYLSLFFFIEHIAAIAI